jgi:thioredoxin-like negative regulator of GroEL
MKFFLPLLALSWVFGALAAGLEEPHDSKVAVLGYHTFTRFVKSNDLSVIEFYAPWCGHCQHLAPVYREAAAMVSEANLPIKVGFGKVDDTDELNRQLHAGSEEMFNFTSYPTIIIIKKNRVKVANKEHWPRKFLKRRWQYYGGGRDTPDDFLFYVTALANNKDPFEEERHIRPGFYKTGGKHATELITELEPDGEMGFNTTVLEDEKNRIWIVEFYSDRCPFCNSLAPEITRAAKTIYEQKGKKVRVGAINSRVYHEVAEQHGVTSWPWVTSFYQGKKVEDMAGLGGWESVYNFAMRIYRENYSKPPPKNTFLDSKWSSKNQAKAKAEAEAAGKEEL